MQEPTKLLALDVENTLIHYSLTGRPSADGRVPGIIDSSLVDIFTQFVGRGFAIVINTGTDGENIDYYKREFQTAGIHGFITSYSPNGGKADDSKIDRLDKYCDGNNFKITNKNDVYYYDDGPEVVARAHAAGYANTSHVTAESPLSEQLIMLLSRLESGNAASPAPIPATLANSAMQPMTPTDNSRKRYENVETVDISAVQILATRGSPVMRRRMVENEGNFAQWYEGVNELFKYVAQLTATYEIDFTDTTAKSYLSSILEAVRKNRYYESAQDPEINLSIPDVIFSPIDDFIQSRRFLVERKGISDTKIKSLATQINQSGIPAGPPMVQNNDSFAKWREGVEVLFTIILQLTKLYEIPDPSSMATTYLGSILDAIRTNSYDTLAKDPATRLGIPSICFDGFEGINTYLEANRYIILRVNISDAQIDSLKAEMSKKSLLSDFEVEASFDRFGW